MALDGKTIETTRGCRAADLIDSVLSGASAAARAETSGGASLLDETPTAQYRLFHVLHMIHT